MSKEKEKELKFLEYFYEEVYDFLGPAAGDAYWQIKKQFQADGGELPDSYQEE